MREPRSPAFVPDRDDVVMSDGRTATLRAVEPEDAAALTALHEDLDDETLRLRFFNVSRTAGRRYVEHLLHADPGEVLALLAEVDGRVVALGTAERVGARSAEVAFVVASDERGHGLGTLLLEHLAHSCAQLGVEEVTADVLAGNTLMEQVFRDAGYRTVRHAESGVVCYELATQETPDFLSAAQRRHAEALARSAGRGTSREPS